MPRRMAVLVGSALALGCGGDNAATPRFETRDVHNFVAVLQHLPSADTTCPGLQVYFDQATPGLRKYRRKFDVGPKELCRAIHRSPQRYADLAGKLPALDSAAGAIATALARFRSLYPPATFPPVYVVVGNGISGGTTTIGPHPIILIGAELLGSAAGLPGSVVHELTHTQQRYPWRGALTGGPAFLRGTLLRHAIKEGSASFLADLVMDAARPSPRDSFALAHEQELWRDFQRDMHGTDYSHWLYNGWNRQNLGGRPPDVGYFIGYRITQAYYDRAPDKSAAIREILTIHDFDRFLRESGYAGGG